MKIFPFKKEYFLPYEEKEIIFEINEEMLKFYNENLEYKAEPGMFKIFVGTNSVETINEVFNLIKE